MCSRSSFALGLAALAIVPTLCGCASSPEDKAAKILANRKKGGYIRLVNLSDSHARLMFGPRQFTQSAPDQGTPYSLYSPGSHDAQLMSGTPEKAIDFKLDVQSDQTAAIYLLEAGQPKTAVITGDDVRAPDDASSIRLVNLAGGPLSLSISSGGDALKAEPGKGSSVKPMAAGTHSLKISGDVALDIEQELVAGTAYSVIVYTRKGKPEFLVLGSNRKQEMQTQGASAAG